MSQQGVKTIGVVGAGQMGRGIAQVCVLSDFAVVLQDVASEILEAAAGGIDRSLQRQVEKGTLSQADKATAVRRIRTTTEMREAAAGDWVIEAVSERLPLKLQIFEALDAACRPEAILASNTSSLSITRLGAATRRPDRVIGMHFMNPVPVMKLVEIVAGQATSAATVGATRELAQALGKTPVVSQDLPGFISNRVLMPMINEAIYALYEGVGSREDIDTVMTLGMRHPMGPLTLADFIGLDTCLSIMEILHAGFGDSKYRPCPLLRRLVEAGHLGR
ncbi:MAG TPA: 3-hydroxyacyl-CoA dehydrogenase NAD-binding domain-containing protein, partial [Candidatus Polarisedimenticolia bacterium]|nr:3-hydroxyacyl-CoA dehydrogenase NAD-binding domain-containing protein [Candidatus Polarisedimenticolia bacterium]